jgi:lipid-A-disaccharide synthase
MSQSPKKIMIIAGEPSGDFIAAQLMKALKKKDPKVIFEGIGGQHMATQGLQTIYSIEDLSIMGFFEDVSKYYGVYKKLKALKSKMLENKPDLLITVDFPGFNFRLGKMIKNNGIKHVHYVAPTVWAWKAWRAKMVAKFLDHLLCVFPFEPPYFEKENLSTTYVGHPIMEMGFDKGTAEAFLEKYDVSPKSTIITLLPGSRQRELDSLIPVYKKTVHILSKKINKLHIVIPTLDCYKDRLNQENWGCPVSIITNFEDRKDAYAASKVALAASGTIALELAAANVPMVITYKISKISEWIARALLKIKHACMVNILLNEGIVPELLQEDCNAESLSQTVLGLLNDSRQQKNALKKVRAMLTPKNKIPSDLAAEAILNIFERG